MPKPDPITRTFSRAAPHYARYAGAQRRIAQELAQLLPNDTPQNILEIGCGPGTFTRHLVEHYPQATLYLNDLSETMLAEAQQHLNHPTVPLAGNFMHLRTPTQMDLITSSATLHWLDSLTDSFQKIKQMLTTHGRFVCSIMLENTLGELHHCRKQAAPEKTPSKRLPTYAKVQEALQATGPWQYHYLGEDHTKEFASSFREVLQTVRQTGVHGGPFSRGKAPLNHRELKAMGTYYQAYFDAHKRYPMTYHYGMIHVQKP